ncbi:MAG: RNA polymerase sigma factor [Firmicutes bacterium]|nr:RNA polymerase sigma factor [Bacillota bacterium]
MRANEKAFETIYQDHFKRIYSFMFRLCSDAHVAEELTQETFFQAYRCISGYRGDASMFTWLCAIGKNVFLNYLRKNKGETIPFDFYVINLAAPPSDEPGYRLTRQVEIEELRRVIAAMPKKYSTVLLLRMYGELSYAEIAKEVGISESSAKVIFYRAKKMIREELIDE